MEMMIKGKLISLREITSKDTEGILSWRNKLRVRRNFIYQELLTREVHENWLNTMVFSKKAVQFVIMDNATGLGVGSVYLRDINTVHKKAEYGIFIGEDNAVGRGYGTEACKMICEYGFRKLGLHKIFLRVLESNTRAIRSYEKSGFRREALLIDDVFIEGGYCNVILMAKFEQCVIMVPRISQRNGARRA